MIVSFVCLVVIFYGGAFIGVILVDYGLDPYHWIYKHAAKTRKETADHADNDEIDEALINTHNSKCSKKRPSLMKVLSYTNTGNVNCNALKILNFMILFSKLASMYVCVCIYCLQDILYSNSYIAFNFDKVIAYAYSYSSLCKYTKS